MRTYFQGGSLDRAGASFSFNYKGKLYTVIVKFNRYSQSRYIEIRDGTGNILTVINQNQIRNDNLLFNVLPSNIRLAYDTILNQYILDQDGI